MAGTDSREERCTASCEAGSTSGRSGIGRFGTRASTRQSAALVRGIDRYGHFDDEPRPFADYGEAERAAHAEAVIRFRAQNAEQFAQYEAAE